MDRKLVRVAPAAITAVSSLRARSPARRVRRRRSAPGRLFIRMDSSQTRHACRSASSLALRVRQRVLWIACDVHLLCALRRHAQRHVRGFLRTNHNVLAPIGKLALRIRPQIVLPGIKPREFIMPARIGVRRVRFQSVGSLNRHARFGHRPTARVQHRSLHRSQASCELRPRVCRAKCQRHQQSQRCERGPYQDTSFHSAPQDRSKCNFTRAIGAPSRRYGAMFSISNSCSRGQAKAQPRRPFNICNVCSRPRAPAAPCGRYRGLRRARAPENR